MVKLNLRNKAHIKRIQNIFETKITKAQFVGELRSLDIFDAYIFKNTKKPLFFQYICWYAFHAQFDINDIVWLHEYIHEFKIKEFEDIYKDGKKIYTKLLQKAEEEEEDEEEDEDDESGDESSNYDSDDSSNYNSYNTQTEHSEYASSEFEDPNESNIPPLTPEQLKMLLSTDNIEITKNALEYMNSILHNIFYKKTKEEFYTLYKKNKKNEILRQIHKNSPDDEKGFQHFIVQTLRYCILKNAIAECQRKSKSQVMEKTTQYVCMNTEDISVCIKLLKT